MICDTSAENAFWEGVFRATATGWQSTRRESDPASSDRIADLRLRVYLVNTHTGWASAMLTHVRDLHQAHQLVNKSPSLREQAEREAIAQVVAASDPAYGANEDLQRSAFESALRALASSTTYTRVIESNPEGLAGHWTLILYKLHDGSYISRPMYWTTPNDTQPLLTPQEVQFQVATAARFDQQSRETRIGRRIAQGGGLLLSPQYA